MKKVFIDKLQHFQNFALTTDIWTDIQKRSHIGITIHFVDNYTINSGPLGVYELDEKYSSEYIASKLVEVCGMWSLSNTSLVAVTTVGAISNVPELITLISKVKNIVRWFKQSVVTT